MSTAPRSPGFDGHPITDEYIRDLYGQGKRHIVRRMRYDVIERLFRYTPPLLTPAQRDAAVRLQVDDQLSKAPVMARAGTMGVSKADSDFVLSEAVLDATARVREARALLGRFYWPVVECVVLNNVNLSRTAKAFKTEQLRIMPKLRTGLDLLAEYYGTR